MSASIWPFKHLKCRWPDSALERVVLTCFDCDNSFESNAGCAFVYANWINAANNINILNWWCEREEAHNNRRDSHTKNKTKMWVSCHSLWWRLDKAFAAYGRDKKMKDIIFQRIPNSVANWNLFLFIHLNGKVYSMILFLRLK